MSVEVGREAPDFELDDQHGRPVRLSGFRGRKSVLLIFYPLAFSGVCASELRELNEHLGDFHNDEVQVLTVSVDSVFAHRVWADQEGFGFPLLSDFWPHGGVASAYGVFDENRGVALRGTFVIDAAGTVRWKVALPLSEARDPDEYRKALAGLQPA